LRSPPGEDSSITTISPHNQGPGLLLGPLPFQEAALYLCPSERKLGELTREMEKQHGARPPDTGLHNVTPPTYAELGLDKVQVHRWQQAAELPEVFNL
jgi:hypothetical protein